MGALYHYTTAGGLVGMINDEKIHCTNYLFMNDPSERKYFDKILKTVLKDAKCKEIYDFCTMINFHPMRERINAYTGSYYLYYLSFIEDRDSLTMWRHYSSPNGCCIEFDKDSINNVGVSINGHRHGVTDVKYNKKEQIDILRATILSYEDAMNSLNNHNLRDCNNSEKYCSCALKFMLDTERHKISFKDSAYKDEKEKRLVLGFPYKKRDEERVFLEGAYYDGIEDGNVSKEKHGTFEDYYNRMNYYDKIKYKTTERGSVVEYLEVDFNPSTAIKSVILHPSSSKNQKVGVERILRNRGIDAKVSKSKKPFRVM